MDVAPWPRKSLKKPESPKGKIITLPEAKDAKGSENRPLNRPKRIRRIRFQPSIF